jgi:predicted XRE-type DNA-binding protein
MPKSKKNAKRRVCENQFEASGSQESSGNVFKDLGFGDDEANKKLLKCQLMIEIERVIKSHGWTQSEAAKKLGVVQPRISELMTTRIDRFTIDMLLKYLNRLGKKVQLTVVDSDVA